MTALAIFFLINNYGSYVKAIRNAFTHLTEEPKKGLQLQQNKRD